MGLETRKNNFETQMPSPMKDSYQQNKHVTKITKVLCHFSIMAKHKGKTVCRQHANSLWPSKSDLKGEMFLFTKVFVS